MAITPHMKSKRDQRQAVARINRLENLRALAATRPAGAGDDEEPYKPLEWPLVRKILHWMKPFRFQYAIALLLNIKFTVLEMLGPLFIRQLIDNDITGHPHYLTRAVGWFVGCFSAGAADRLDAAIAPTRPYWNIACTIGLWGLAVLTANLINRFNMEYNRRTGEKVIANIRKALFGHLQELSMSYYDRTKFGRILSRATNDIDALSNPIINGINTVFTNAMMMTVAAAMLFISDWRIALATLWLGPVLYVLHRIYSRHMGMKWRVAREHYTRVATNLAENINGMRVVTAFNRQEDNLFFFNALQEGNTNNNVRAAGMNGAYQSFLTVFSFIGAVIILITGAWLAFTPAPDGAAHAFTIGTLIALMMYWGWFMNPVLNFGQFQNEMMQSMASAERVFTLLDLQPDVTDAPHAAPLPRLCGHVAFENVSFQYLKDKPVLHDISFDVKPGQTVALVGHTGCGKTTIINLLCRFYLPQHGRILLDGHDLAQVTTDSLHRQLGIVSQNNFLFTGTVMENIRYAYPAATDEQVIAAARALGSHDILGSMKDGYHTPVGERGASVSLGQRQLICFTRAFLANPRILMLDEATSAVDTHTEMAIQEALNRLVADRTTFVVAHRLSTVTRADLVLVLDHGRIIERGTHASLLALAGKYAELYKEFTRAIA
jgi:ATP-binding cassette subfamily B protein